MTLILPSLIKIFCIQKIVLPNTIVYSIYRIRDDIELTMTKGSIAESVSKTGIACTIEPTMCIGTCGINTAIVSISIALVYV